MENPDYQDIPETGVWSFIMTRSSEPPAPNAQKTVISRPDPNAIYPGCELTIVSKYANFALMSYAITYFNPRVKVAKTRHAPEQELKTARKRMKEVKNG